MGNDSLSSIARKVFWRRVLRFAYHRLMLVPGRLPDGIPGIRDVDRPCAGFTLMNRGEQRGALSKCPSDGHYLCQECAYISPEALQKLHVAELVPRSRE